MELYSGQRLFSVHTNCLDIDHARLMESILGPIPRSIKVKSQLWNIAHSQWINPIDNTLAESTPPLHLFAQSSNPASHLRDLKSRIDPSEHLFLDLVSKMLCYDQENRITALEALQHPYFNNT